MLRSCVAAAVAALALAVAPAAASAVAPANDAPAGAVGFTTVTAENGTPTERQGIATLTDATADAGIAPCLGDGSFGRTVWFRVPAATAPRLVEVTGTGGSGDRADVPDLAAYVLPATASPSEPQDCDGAEVTSRGDGIDDAADVAVRVPAGRAVLIQAGRPAAQAAQRIVLSESELALPGLPALLGDVAGDAPALALGSTTRVALGGATVTEEDPAQPACPASGTAWRRVTAVGTGTHQIRVAGDDVTAVTAFVGAAPTADDAVTCQLRTASGAEIDLDVPAASGQTIWIRLGSESDAADAAGTLAVGGPGAPVPTGPLLVPPATGGSGSTGAPGSPGAPGTPGTTGAAALPRVSIGLVSKRRAVRLRATGGSLRSVRVTIQRRVGSRYRTVARATKASLVSGRRTTVELKRTGSLSVRGRYRFLVSARTAAAPARTVAQTRTRALGRG